jgi:hypothetical protein
VLLARRAGPGAKRPGAEYVACEPCSSSGLGGVRYLPDLGAAAAVPAERKARLRADLGLMLGNCDGARAKDDRGFNGVDASAARDFAAALALGEELDWAELEAMLRKYRGTQLGPLDREDEDRKAPAA